MESIVKRDLLCLKSDTFTKSILEPDGNIFDLIIS
jgi:hypothetical protein